MTKSVTERDMVSRGPGNAILGVVCRKTGIWCVLKVSTLGEAVRFVGLPCAVGDFANRRTFFRWLAKNDISSTPTLN